MELKKRISTFCLKGISLVIALSLYSFGSVAKESVDRSISSMSPAEADKRIKNLKKSLSSAKSGKRGQIIKQIAEIENKVLEKSLSSSSSRR